MRVVFLLLLFPVVSFANETADIFPDRAAILTRQIYANELETQLKTQYKHHYSVSLFGMELEHLLIVSPNCESIEKIDLTSAAKTGIMSARCVWWGKTTLMRVK